MTVTEVFADENRVIERKATTEEITQREKTALYFAHIEQDKLDKATAKAALLERLGITADEAALLIS
jgi:hypothetical protein